MKGSGYKGTWITQIKLKEHQFYLVLNQKVKIEFRKAPMIQIDLFYCQNYKYVTV